MKKYDVFLSFRGEDTRNNILSHLHEALVQKKVETYMDNRIGIGDEISLTLFEAIEDSYVSIVIFSENYASSKWCLDEISKIMECKKERKQVVIPVFYKIDPSNVRKQTGRYKQAFEKHEMDLKHDIGRVQKWKNSLTEVTNLAGWDSRNFRTESELIKDIVGHVLEELTFLYPRGEVVGIGKSSAHVESLLQIGTREILTIGILGKGAIGKTTLAYDLYDKLSSQFDGHCFLANVFEISERYGINVIRNQLFSQLLGENVCLDAPTVESSFLLTMLRRKKVLIVLDDVANSEQLEDIINDYYLGHGSRVIVTSRDYEIWRQVDYIYEVSELNLWDSCKLFCWCAFRQRRPMEGYEELSERAIAFCNGMPLNLKVLGYFLRERSIAEWESGLAWIRRTRNAGSDPFLIIMKKSEEFFHQNMQNEYEAFNELFHSLVPPHSPEPQPPCSSSISTFLTLTTTTLCISATVAMVAAVVGANPCKEDTSKSDVDGAV